MISAAARNHLLALADDEHIIGARHARWIGLGPFLEEDLAFCSIAQDELGHAIALYEIILDTIDDRSIDHFALLRAPEDYRSSWLAEASCSSWNDALVRHWLYDHAEALRWEALAGSSIAAIADRVGQVQREENFHRQHADLLMSKALTTTPAARSAIVGSVHALLPLAAGLWDPLIDEAEALDEGVMTAGSAELGERWWEMISTQLDRWSVSVGVVAQADLSRLIVDASTQQRNRLARSSEFDDLLASLQEVITLDTTARW